MGGLLGRGVGSRCGALPDGGDAGRSKGRTGFRVGADRVSGFCEGGCRTTGFRVVGLPVGGATGPTGETGRSTAAKPLWSSFLFVGLRVGCLVGLIGCLVGFRVGCLVGFRVG